LLILKLVVIKVYLASSCARVDISHSLVTYYYDTRDGSTADHFALFPLCIFLASVRLAVVILAS